MSNSANSDGGNMSNCNYQNEDNMANELLKVEQPLLES